jgi:hypothetical protein
MSERQVQRLKRRYQPDSVGWVQHGNRGRSMPWAVSIPQKQLILRLARGKYQGFNDSHLAEKLGAQENLSVSCETGVSAETPASPISLAPASASAFRHDGSSPMPAVMEAPDGHLTFAEAPTRSLGLEP